MSEPLIANMKARNMELRRLGSVSTVITLDLLDDLLNRADQGDTPSGESDEPVTDSYAAEPNELRRKILYALMPAEYLSGEQVRDVADRIVEALAQGDGADG